jgi:hypothetical protein
MRKAGVMRSAFTSRLGDAGNAIKADPTTVTTPEGRCKPEPSPKPQRNLLRPSVPMPFGLFTPRSCSQGSALLAGWLCKSVRQSVLSCARALTGSPLSARVPM